MHEHQDRPYFVHSVVVRSWVSGCEVVYSHIESHIFAGNTLSESPFLLCYTIATDTSSHASPTMSMGSPGLTNIENLYEMLQPLWFSCYSLIHPAR